MNKLIRITDDFYCRVDCIKSICKFRGQTMVTTTVPQHEICYTTIPFDELKVAIELHDKEDDSEDDD